MSQIWGSLMGLVGNNGSGSIRGNVLPTVQSRNALQCVEYRASMAGSLLKWPCAHAPSILQKRDEHFPDSHASWRQEDIQRFLEPTVGSSAFALRGRFPYTFQMAQRALDVLPSGARQSCEDKKVCGDCRWQ